MKIKRKLLPLLGVFIIVFVFIKANFGISYYPEPDFYDQPYQIKESKMDLLNDSLRIAQQKLDNIKYEHSKYVKGSETFEWLTFGTLGYAKTVGSYKRNNVKDEMFLTITSTKLDLYEYVSKSYLQYYTKDGIGYLSRLKFIKQKEADSVVYIDQKVGFRYFPKNNAILIPITSTVGKLIIPSIGIIVAGFEIIFYLYVIRIFLAFLFAISRNEIFDLQNINRLRKISLSLLVLSIYPYIVNGIAYLLIILNFGKDRMLFNYSFWNWDCYLLIGSIVVYLIYIAFKRGMELQQEQDLTI